MLYVFVYVYWLTDESFSQQLVVNISDDVKTNRTIFSSKIMNKKNTWFLVSSDIVQCNIYIVKL